MLWNGPRVLPKKSPLLVITIRRILIFTNYWHVRIITRVGPIEKDRVIQYEESNAN